MSIGSDRFITLRGDLVIPVEPWLLTMNLQGRGFRLIPEGDDLLVSPFSQLTSEDCRQIRRWKRHVLALLEYSPLERVQ